MTEEPTEEPTDLRSKINATREEFSAELANKRAERDKLLLKQQAELAAVNDDLNVLTGVVAALNGRTTQPKKPKANRQPPPPSRVNATGHGISIQLALHAAEVIDKLTAEKGVNAFTQRELYRALDWDQGKGSAAVRYLRSIGHLRKAGRDGRAVLWAVMDREAITREASLRGVTIGATDVAE